MKKILRGTLVSLMTIFALAIFSSPTANASSKFEFVKMHWGQTGSAYVPKTPKKSVTIWNRTHTKKLGNMKNYPSNTWWSLDTYAVIKHNNKNYKYQNVSYVKNKQTHYGYVWNGYLKPGMAKDSYKKWDIALSAIPRNMDYLNFVKYSPSQELTRSIQKLFPKTKITLDLTRVGIDKYYLVGALDDKSPVTETQAAKISNYKNVKSLPKITAYLKSSPKKSTATRLAHVKKLLANYGYTAKKRASMKGYELGLKIEDNNKHGQKIVHPANYEYTFVIAQRK